MLGRALDPAHALDALVQVDDGGLGTGADIEDTPVVSGRGERRRDDVADEDVVARLRPVAVDPRRLRVPEGIHEDRHDAGLAVRVLPRPIHVAVAERDVRAAVEAVVRPRVLLRRGPRHPAPPPRGAGGGFRPPPAPPPPDSPPP